MLINSNQFKRHFDGDFIQGVVIQIGQYGTIKPICNVVNHLASHAIRGNYDDIYSSGERQLFMIHLFSQ